MLVGGRATATNMYATPNGMSHAGMGATATTMLACIDIKTATIGATETMSTVVTTTLSACVCIGGHIVGIEKLASTTHDHFDCDFDDHACDNSDYDY